MDFKSRLTSDPKVSFPSKITLIWVEDSWNYFWLLHMNNHWITVIPRDDSQGNAPKTYETMIIPMHNIVSIIFAEKLDD